MQINSIGKKEEKKSNAKKYVLISLIICIVLLFLVLILVVLFNADRPRGLSLVVNGQTKEYSQDTFVFEENNIYISLKDVSKLIGYRYEVGGYKQYTEDKTKCYLESDDEIVTYELGEDIMYKSMNNEKMQYSEFKMSKPLKSYKDKLYICEDGLEVGCNLNFTYNQTTNQITIDTLPTLYKKYSDKAKSKEYTNVEALSEDFENQKAILYGMLIVKSIIKEQEKYGVISLNGEDTYLGIKYDKIQFLENSQEFLVKGENKYGIMTKSGEQKIPLEYDKIKILDSIEKLYYVENNGKIGVLDKDGKVLGNSLYADYDEIGLDATIFTNDNIKNSMLLYGNCIPVRKGNKWGFFNVSGDLISKFNWDSLGYIDKENNKNLLLVEYISGIVVSKDGAYGIIDYKGKLLVACIFDKIYTETEEGKSKFYIRLGETEFELDKYLETQGINVDKLKKNN